MATRRVRRRRTAVVLATVLAIGLAPAASRAFVGAPPRSTTYVVRSGDSLWSIATRSAPGQDPRIVVDAIARANDVDAAHLVPGQELRLPVELR